MPDYNPAVAAGIQPPQSPNWAGTLGTVANIQAEQARTNLYTLQALQQQRRYMGLTEMGNYAATHPGDASGIAAIGARYGVEPETQTQYINQGALQKFTAANGGYNPQGAEAKANIALRGAETTKTNLESAKLRPEIDQAQKADAAAAAAAYFNSGDRSPIIAHAQKYHDVNDPRGGGAMGISILASLPKDQFDQVAKSALGAGPKGTEITQTETPEGAKAYQTLPNLVAGGGVVGPTIAKAEAAKTQAAVPAELDKELQERTQGAVEAIQRLTRLKNAVKNSDNLNFGSMLGSETAREFNPSPALAAEHDNLQSLYRDAGSAMLKSRFGSRVTNMDVTQGLKIVGGTTVQNKETALKILDNNTAEAYDAIANGIQRGIINPSDVLARPGSKAEADSLGTGALWINSKGEIKRNPR